MRRSQPIAVLNLFNVDTFSVNRMIGCTGLICTAPTQREGAISGSLVDGSDISSGAGQVYLGFMRKMWGLGTICVS
jgi:hypothetical protein